MSASGQVVHVRLGERSYHIEIGSGNLSQIGRFVTARCAVSRAVVITDANVEPLFAQQAVQRIAAEGPTTDLLVVPAGEATKSVESARILWEKLLDLGADRKSVVVAVGGGVVGDLAGFTAATFARGIAFVQVPTTLLAQVDSSVGGKVGINLPGAKNMIGAFWQPRGVLIDTEVLASLPDREYCAGLAEVVKYGVILDADFFSYLENHIPEINNRQPETLAHVVARCCQLKAGVVEQDEREETGVRAVLNYGHTFCHAIEAATGYGRLLHGEAVAIGMLCASRLAERLGRIGPEITDRQKNLLAGLGLPTKVPEIEGDRLLELMQHDKKTESGKLRFVLPARMGQVEVVADVDPSDVREALADG